ncbi:hypothetical protein Zmor_009359 [Zophobas morio]|uniref:Methyltransferase domain-containing protein n=1 Tax=Zophobas morio TaxID=2755281 RepID=A0AA38IQK0_9CUCU|nr:hypothetical protein Zmor_009359 [Zophobas morio]
MNDDAVLYSKHSNLQKSDAAYILDKYSNLLNWRDGDKILDVGAGEGSVSIEVLLPRLPTNFHKLTLSDISPQMLKFAQERCEDSRLDCLLMDISVVVPESLHQQFDHIFSFYCLQWVADENRQEQAWKNIFDLLKPGGDTLVTIIATGPLFDFSESMAKMEKWAPFMGNVKRVISPYHHIENPADKLKNFLEKTGFLVKVCETEERCYVYSSTSQFLDWGFSVNPFIKTLPENERPSFIEEYKRQVFTHKKIIVEKGDNGGEKIHKMYTMLTACASKPLY